MLLMTVAMGMMVRITITVATAMATMLPEMAPITTPAPTLAITKEAITLALIQATAMLVREMLQMLQTQVTVQQQVQTARLAATTVLALRLLRTLIMRPTTPQEVQQTVPKTTPAPVMRARKQMRLRTEAMQPTTLQLTEQPWATTMSTMPMQQAMVRPQPMVQMLRLNKLLDVLRSGPLLCGSEVLQRAGSRGYGLLVIPSTKSCATLMRV